MGAATREVGPECAGPAAEGPDLARLRVYCALAGSANGDAGRAGRVQVDMSDWRAGLLKGLDGFLKLDLLRYLFFARGKPVAAIQAAEDLGCDIPEVAEAFRDFVALGIVDSCWQDGGPRFRLTRSPEARRAIDDLLNSWAGLQRAVEEPAGDAS